MALLFDLDQTIIDSSSAEKYRKSGQWSTVYALISQFKLYPGVIEAIEFAKKNGLKICIVTSSPSTYCQKVLDHWKIPYDQKVCYHDTSKRKPYPDPLERGMQLIECAETKNAISFGDRAVDIQASKAAKVMSVGCTWGSTEVNELRSAIPDMIIESPTELIPIIKKCYNLK
jgi:HAD superfamily hydrolase (TIGR01549 family)